MGSAKMHCVMTSGVGVTTAATIKMIKTAYFRLRSRNAGLTTPRRDSKKIATGISKTSPMPRIILLSNPKRLLTVSAGWKSPAMESKKRAA